MPSDHHLLVNVTLLLLVRYREYRGWFILKSRKEPWPLWDLGLIASVSSQMLANETWTALLLKMSLGKGGRKLTMRIFSFWQRCILIFTKFFNIKKNSLSWPKKPSNSFFQPTIKLNYMVEIKFSFFTNFGPKIFILE